MLDFDALCDQILDLDSGIRFTAVINRNGEKISGCNRPDIITMLSEDEQKMELYHAGQRWESRKNLIHKIGKAKFSLTEYEKIKRITFPVDEKHLLLVTSDINSDAHKITQLILDLIGKNQEN